MSDSVAKFVIDRVRDPQCVTSSKIDENRPVYIPQSVATTDSAGGTDHPVTTTLQIFMIMRQLRSIADHLELNLPA